MCRAKSCDGGRRCLDLNAAEKRAKRKARQIGREAREHVDAYISGDVRALDGVQMATMQSRPSYYDTDEWTERDEFIRSAAARHGVTLTRDQHEADMWLGEVEPAGAFEAKASSMEKLHAWAAEVASRHDQDSVLVAQVKRGSEAQAATYGPVAGAEAAAVLGQLRAAGIAADRTVDGRLQLVSTPDAPIPGAAHALLSARYGHEGTDQVRTAFVTADRGSKHAPIRDIQRVRAAHTEERATTAPKPIPYLTDSDDIAAAKFYADAPHEPGNKRVERSYSTLRSNVREQYNRLVREGYQFEPWDDAAKERRRDQIAAEARQRAIAAGKDPRHAEARARRTVIPDQPYGSTAEMMHDLRKNKRLYYSPMSEAERRADGGRHPMAMMMTVEEPVPRFKTGPRAGRRRDGKPEDTPTPTRRIPARDAFRAVHDAFGHTSGQFGPSEQRRAWWTHRNALPAEARIALWNETRGQTCWTNAGPHMQVSENGKPRLVRQDEQAWLPLSQRPSAPQKCVDAPKWLV